MAKIDTRMIDLPSTNGSVYAVQNGLFTAISYVDSKILLMKLGL